MDQNLVQHDVSNAYNHNLHIPKEASKNLLTEHFIKVYLQKVITTNAVSITKPIVNYYNFFVYCKYNKNNYPI